jgi:hypothetical protein
MKESRLLTIHDKIITLHDLRRLADIIVSLSPPRTSENQRAPDVSFIARCDDNSTFESEDIDIFADSSPINSKRVLSIEMDFSCYETKSFVKVELRHGSPDYNNCISVRGPDSTWVNGTLRRLQEALDSFSPQRNIVKEWTPVLRPIFAFSLGILIVKALEFFIAPNPDPNPPHWVEVLRQNVYALLCAYYAIIYLFGVFPGTMLHAHVVTYWPSVEFQVGPPHTHFERKRRLWIMNALLFGVFPFVTSIVYDLVKTYILR